MSKPDSLLTAAKRLAGIAGMSWSEVQPYYRALQEGDGSEGSGWLPKSLGRNIWAAHPHYITRLLIALAGADHFSKACETIEWARELTPDGRPRHLTEEPASGVPLIIEWHLSPFLVDPTAARELVNVEVRPDEGRIIFNTKSQGAIVFARPHRPKSDADRVPRPFQGIHRRGVIEGSVFVDLALRINWRTSDQPPLEKVQQGEVGDED